MSCSDALNMEERFISSRPGHEVIKLFPCSSQLSTKFILLINVKISVIIQRLRDLKQETFSFVGILVFMSI